MQTLAGTIHKSEHPYVSIVGSNSIEVRLQTPKDVVESVGIGYNDPYNYKVVDQWIELEANMEKYVSDDLYDWWVITLEVDTKRFAYNFKINTKSDGLWFLTEAGITRDFEVLYQFNLPFSHDSEIFTYPQWVNSAIWYQIFPDRFATDNPKLDWHDGEVSNREVYGGNIQGIINKLDYLAKLGINSIYFTPLFKAGSVHKYDTIDYFEIDPQFGTEEDFKDLIDMAHSKGIRIMLDGVFNHTSNEHPHFKDVMEKREHSKYKDWYHVRDYDKLDQVFEEDFRVLKAYDAFSYVEQMPKLNTQNPEVIEYIFKAVTKWTELGIDGWRLDVANEVNHEFWKLFKKHVQAINPDIYIIGEIWHDAITWLRGDEFHAVMNYKYTNAIIDYFFKKKIDLVEFKNRTTRAKMEYTTAVNKAAFNILDSHDTPRIKTVCDEDKVSQMLGTVFLMTQEGSPCIYYGTEVGLAGKQDPDNRRLMPWNENNWDTELLDFYKQIIKARLDHPVLANDGAFKFIENDCCQYIKYDDDNEYMVTLNTTNCSIDYKEHNIILAKRFSSGILEKGGFIIDKLK